MLYCWQKINDRNLEQRICIKIGKSTSKTLEILKIAYGEYAMKKLCFLNAQESFDAHNDSWWSAQNTKNRCKCVQSVNFGVLRSKIKSATDKRSGCDLGNSVVDSNRIWE